LQASGLVSILIHAAAVAAAAVTVMWMGLAPESVPTPTAAHGREPEQLPRMIFLPKAGPAAGGGGGGNRQPMPPSRAQAIGRDRMTIPVGRPVVPSGERTDATAAPPGLALAVKPLASGTSLLLGLPDAPASRPFSQGPGIGGGVGTGRGTGIGSGTGPGIGSGSGGGFGGGAYRLGSGGVVAPTLLKEVRPKYTPAALRDRLEGTVVLEVVVGRDGHPGAIRVIRSLDPGGLDQEAILAARDWRFTPGRVGDTPVDVLVTIQVDFHIR
jgi:TonB family protein